MKRLLNEPVRLAGAIRAVLLAFMAFGLDLTADQLAASMIAIELVLMEINRALVVPNRLAEARVAAGGSPTQPMGRDVQP